MGSGHAERFASLPEVKVVACADIRQEAARQLASEHGARAYTNGRRLLADHRVDIAVICTPTPSHAEFIQAAAARGKHIFCEKPLAFSAAEAREMVDAAQKHRVLLMTAFCHRFHDPVMRAKKLIDSGRLGRIVMYRNRFGGAIPMAESWFGSKAQGGGGALLDTAVHSADLFRFLVGEAAAVAATAATLVQRLDVEDCAAVLVRAASGAIGVIEASWSTPYAVNDIEIYGERGAAIVDYDRDVMRYRVEGMKRWRTVRAQAPDRFAREVGHFVSCVRGEEQIQVSGVDGLRAQLIIEAAYRSAATGAWVSL